MSLKAGHIFGGGFSSPRRKQACDRRCPRTNRVGVKLPPRAIAVRRGSRVVYPEKPLTRDISAGLAPKGAVAARSISCAEGDFGAVCGV
jgi:hypothetical protein